MRLREAQLAMLAVISAPEGVEAALWDAGGLERAIAGDARLGAAGRLGVYADMYRLRLRAALAATFPHTALLLGDAGFAAIADGYFAAHPSRAPSLRDAGAAFPGFLDARAAGWAADLARLEWARHDVFDAADQPLLDVAAVQARGPAGVAALPLRLIAAHRRVAVAHAAEVGWRALQRGEDPGVPPPAPRVLLVWREGVQVFHRAVDALEARVLAGAAAGTTFAALCEEVSEPEQAAQLLARWLGDGLLVA
jgi:hypothetical protein